MEKKLSIKDELGEKLVKEYRDFLALDIVFKYLTILELSGNSAYEKKRKQKAREYLDTLLADKYDLKEQLEKIKDDIKKQVLDFDAYNCYSNEMAVLNEAYSSNYNELDLYEKEYSKEKITADIVAEYKRAAEDEYISYDFITYMNFIIPSRYTRIRYKDKMARALKIEKLGVEEQRDLAYELTDYVNSAKTLRSTQKIAFCENKIAKIKDFFNGEENGVDEKYILSAYTEISDRQLMTVGLINIMQAIGTYMLLSAEEKSDYSKYMAKIDSLTDDDLNKMSQVHYRALEKLNHSAQFAKLQDKLHKLDEIFFIFELDYAWLVHKFLNRKEVFTHKEAISADELAALLVDACTNKGESKLIKRVRMRVLMSELPVTFESVDELFDELENAFVSASKPQLNWFTSELYEYLGEQ